MFSLWKQLTLSHTVASQLVGHDLHGAPQIVLHSPDPDEDFVEVPFVSWPGKRRRRRPAKVWPNFLHQRRIVS